jgi:23S rRNA pseudoU1915 N3-methylase RlmH
VATVEKIALIAKIGTAFTPSAPIDKRTLFAGRFEQLRDAITAVSQKGQHAVIYGERGVGKTSLANVVYETFGDQVNKPSCGPINCDESMSFSSLWHAAFREMHLADGTTMDDLAPEEIRPDDVRHILQNIKKSVIVFDELDRLGDRTVTTKLADCIKNISDHGIDTTIVLVGVADSVEHLVAEHVSIERNLKQIPMPRMSDHELMEVIENGSKICAMAIEADAANQVLALSQGLPHYTHLLALNAFQDAVERGSSAVDRQDVDTAIRRALKTAQHSLVSGYHKAVTSPRKDNLYAQVLLACAMSETDSLGYFYAGDVRGPMSRIMGRPYEIPNFSQHMKAFCEPDRGPVLSRTGYKRRYRFRFVNPLMQPYVIMNGLTSGLITRDQIPRVGRDAE